METIDESEPRERVVKTTRPIVTWFIVGAAVSAGIILRWWQLGKASLWFDEGYTAWVVSLHLKGIVHVIRVDTAPPLYYFLLRGWSGLFGRSEAGLRSMSALMATIGLLFLVAISWKLLRSPWARAVAVVLFSTSFMQIAYAHEARFYAMMSMAGAIDLYLVLLVCERSTLVRLAALVCAWTFSLYTNNIMAIYLACLGIAWLVIPGERTAAGRVRDLLIVSVLSAICFAPWVPAMLAQTQRIQGAFWLARPDRWDLIEAIGSLAGIHEGTASRGCILTIDIALLGLVISSCGSRVCARRVIGLLSFGLLPILAIFIYSQVRQPIFVDRAFLPSGIVIPLLVGLSIDAAGSRTWRLLTRGFAVILIFLCLRSLPGHLLGEHPEAWREAVSFAKSSSAKNRLVICVASDGELLFRYYGCQSDYSLRSDVTAAPASFFALDPPRTMQRVKGDQDLDSIRGLLAGREFDEVVLLSSHPWWGDADQRTLRLLTSQLSQFDRKVFTAITVYRYKAHPG